LPAFVSEVGARRVEDPITTAVSGHLIGLKAAQKHALERVFRRTVPPAEVITSELATFLAEISSELNRQVGVVIDRRGRIQHVIVGDHERLFLPDLGRQRAGRQRLRGVRLVHTHLQGERLTKDDLTDLTKLQLDLIAAIAVGPGGVPTTIEIAHLVPPRADGVVHEVREPVALGRTELDFEQFIEELEGRFAATTRGAVARDGDVRAIAVHVTQGSIHRSEVQRSLEELSELARTAGVALVETIVQRRPQPDPRYLVGRGKLQDLALAALHHDAELVVFDQDLSPSQARSIAEIVELKVIDRTQLILDIFAQRATSNDGKLQVELAQLKYALPRLAGKGTAMSRLMGGVGGRGPGETKLEIDRRRAKERITLLQRKIDELGRQRVQRRAKRGAGRVPVAAIVGYTNAGKSTLLNTLTGAEVLAEDKLFATLDPTARRLRFPNDVELVLTDTVGFIRDLPEDLVAAFKATLEELGEADVLVHVVDVSQPGWEERMNAVNAILGELALRDTPVILTFNKVDRLEPEEGLALARRWEAVPVSAIDRRSLRPLTERLMRFYGDRPKYWQVGGDEAVVETLGENEVALRIDLGDGESVLSSPIAPLDESETQVRGEPLGSLRR
jgi:GTP-binding protein HflX